MTIRINPPDQNDKYTQPNNALNNLISDLLIKSHRVVSERLVTLYLCLLTVINTEYAIEWAKVDCASG